MNMTWIGFSDIRATAIALAARLHRSNRGSAMAYAAVAMLVLTAGGGLAVDAGQAFLVKSRLSQALDAAALAGGRAMNAATRDTEIRAFFAANYPTGYLGATVQPITIVPDTANGMITVSTTATLSTSLMRVIGVKTMSVTATSTVKIQTTGMELVLVMDNTQSMSSNNKMTRMKEAANDLLDILYGTSDTSPNLWVGLVPFVTSVNIGSQYTGWLTGYNAANYTPVGWAGCVEARANPYEEENADEPPTGAQKFKPYFWPSNKGVVYKDKNGRQYRSGSNNQSGSILTNDNEYMNIAYASSPSNNYNYGIRQDRNMSNHRGPNAGCHWAKVTPLQPSKATAVAAVADMYSNTGEYTGTHTPVGTAWGWRVLSPKWRGYWGSPTPATLPYDYGKAGMMKVMVLLSDGANTYIDRSGYPPGCAGLTNCNTVDGNYGAYGRISENRFGLTGSNFNSNGFADQLDLRQTRLCNAMKAQGIVVMTILLQENSTSIQNVFKNCATKAEYYFYAPSSDDLKAIFTLIGNELSSLRLYK